MRIDVQRAPCVQQITLPGPAAVGSRRGVCELQDAKALVCSQRRLFQITEKAAAEFLITQNADM